jgi:hypothetical protein
VAVMWTREKRRRERGAIRPAKPAACSLIFTAVCPLFISHVSVFSVPSSFPAILTHGRCFCSFSLHLPSITLSFPHNYTHTNTHVRNTHTSTRELEHAYSCGKIVRHSLLSLPIAPSPLCRSAAAMAMSDHLYKQIRQVKKKRGTNNNNMDTLHMYPPSLSV